ncbi:TetR/AcrR family transcriptional regulator [Actinomadura sp. KC345]|uniref:TetR/AcrR family transcriptional regulator n=1 Tax=Actinomadura sp. KC345 TaxID=2530371 RepID=UPI00104C12B8|nr:TetR/AcrR family transcriptional regulator [Actinomadura sp. KC345]TDC50790.1 TetR/AcrR family transcriptional regulator [Actinomadura sp. KC345]
MSPSARNRRADAQRSRAAVLDAAVQILETRPDAGLGTIAHAAGVTRQTVYAHFASREQLLLAVVDRISEEFVAAIDGADLDSGPASDALLRLLDASERVARRYPVLLQQVSALPVSPQTEHEQHAPVAARIRQVILRGREAGEFDDRLPIDWLVAVTVKLAHAASEEPDAGRVPPAEADRALRITLLRVLGGSGHGTRG